MNYIKNDYEKHVISIGSPGSIERVKIQYPKLIEQLNSLYFESYDSGSRRVDLAVEIIRQVGITSDLETSSILKASKYGEEVSGSVTDMVCSFMRN